MKKPTQEEIRKYMELHNNDEVGQDDKWTLEDAEYHLLLSDKYYKEEKKFKCRNCGMKYKNSFCSTNDIGICRWCSGEEK